MADPLRKLAFACALLIPAACQKRPAVTVASPMVAGTLAELDLAGSDGTTQTRSVAPGTVQLLLRNRLPDDKIRYGITAVTRNIPIPVLDTGGLKPREVKTAAGIPPAACVAVRKAIDSLLHAEDESRVPNLIQAVDKTLLALSKADEAKCPEHRPYADTVRLATVVLVNNLPSVAAGQQLELTITRRQEESSAMKTWRAIYTTGPRGNWRVGFGYVGIRYRGAGRPDKYFSRDSTLTITTPTGTRDSTIYLITRQRDQDVWSDPIPAFLFSWLPASRELSNLSVGPTAGLSVDFSKPRLMLGLESSYNQNVMVSVGGAYTPVSRLRGTYGPDQVVLEPLTDDQLHNEKYRWHPYIGIVYRFNSNPFSSKP